MTGRLRWLLSGGLLVLAGGLTAVSTWRHWDGCRPDLAAPTCLAVQETTYGLPLWGRVGHRDTIGTALGAVAAVLLGLAWLVVIGWARKNLARTLMATVIALQPLVVALLVDLELVAPGRFFAVGNSGWLTWPAEILILPMLLGAGWILDESFGHTLRLILLGWGVTSFGAVHHFVDYVGSMLLAPQSVETPPGMGYVTAATQIMLGVLVGLISLLLRPEDEGEDDDLPGRDGFMLAA
ncbi:MAG: hypothetical protein ABWY56_03005 [Propionibacteriaceae bacterium]